MGAKTKAEVVEYASKHTIEEKLTAAVNEAILSNSPDPLGVIAAILQRESAARGAVDYDLVRNEIKSLLENQLWDDGSLGPKFVRLAWHSSGTWDPVTKTGGSNGAGMRFEAERSDPENNGLMEGQAFLEPIKKKFPGISYSDLWVLAAYVFIEQSGGPAMEFTPGRVDHADENAPAMPPIGRLPAAEKYIVKGQQDEQGRAMGWEKLAMHIRDEVFGRMGFTDRETVALITGGHVYGRCHPQDTGYAGAWVEEPTKWSNEYAADMVGDDWRLVTKEDTWLESIGAKELIPSGDKQQYVNRKKPDEIEAPDATQFLPGKYKVCSGFVNVRKEPDVKSDIIGQPQRDECLNLVAVKLFGTAVRGRLDTSGWVSIIASGGKVLFEREGDLELQPGTYRTAGECDLHSSAGGDKTGKLPAGDHKLASVALGADGRAIWAEVEGGAGWLAVLSEENGVVADRIVEGFNDKQTDKEFEDPPAPNQMMLVSDMVLAWDPEYRKVIEEYAENEEALTSDFGAAFKKLTELGCNF